MTKIKIGKIPVYKGEYDNNTTYNRLNQVTYLGTTFQSIVDDNLGHPPAEKEDGGEILYINTNYWDIVAKGIDNVEERTATNNSMGYKILKKNKSFIEQVTEENTIYEIRYNFTLTEDITIPANCVLWFNGGSISGAYTITGNNTGISAGLVKIFNTDVTLAGTWNVTEAYPEWFGAKGDEVTDDSSFVQKTVNTFSNVNLSRKTYKFNSGITISSTVNIYNGAVTANSIRYIFSVSADNCTIENIAINGNQTCAVGIYIVRHNNVSVKGCSVQNLKSSQYQVVGVHCHLTDSTTITNCTFNNIEAVPNGTIGDGTGSSRAVYASESTNTIIDGVILNNIISSEDGDGIHIMNDNSNPKLAAKIINCRFGFSTRRLLKIQSTGVVIDNCFFETTETIQSCITLYKGNCQIRNSIINCEKSENCIIVGTTDYSISDITIDSNNITWGVNANYQGIVTANGDVDSLRITNNRATIENTENYLFYSRKNLSNIEISNNISNGGSDIIFLRNDLANTTNISNIRVVGNHFTCDKSISRIDNKQENGVNVITFAEIYFMQNVSKVSNINNKHRCIWFSYTDGEYIRDIICDKNNFDENYPYNGVDNGYTGSRPDFLSNNYKDIGFKYFDKTINKPIWWNGSDWVDATGTQA